MTPSLRLRRRVILAGAANTTVLLTLTMMSFPLTSFVPFGELQPRERATVEHLLQPLSRVAPRATDWISRQFGPGSVFSHRLVRVATYILPLLLSTLIAAVVISSLARDPAAVDDSVVRALAIMPVAFLAVSIPALPIFTHDFWLSIAWGRMFVAGENPYYQNFSQAALIDLPFEAFDLRMTYGPLWALLATALAWLCNHRLVLEFFAFKLVHAAFWLATLWLLLRCLDGTPPLHRAVALCLYAWLPASLRFTVAEGHNDIAMVCFLTAWLLLAQRRSLHGTALALAASALCKYVTAPLILAELLYARVATHASWRTIIANLALVATVALAVFALVWQGPGFFSAVGEMRSWTFFTPADAVVSLLGWGHLRVPYFVIAYPFRVVFWTLAGLMLLRLARTPTRATLAEATLATLSAIAFTSVGHMWPWFITWLLVPLAVAPHTVLARFVLPCVIFCPFLYLYWILATGWGQLPIASVLFYGAVTVAAVWWPRTTWARLTSLTAGHVNWQASIDPV